MSDKIEFIRRWVQKGRFVDKITKWLRRKQRRCWIGEKFVSRSSTSTWDCQNWCVLLMKDRSRRSSSKLKIHDTFFFEWSVTRWWFMPNIIHVSLRCLMVIDPMMEMFKEEFCGNFFGLLKIRYQPILNRLSTNLHCLMSNTWSTVTPLNDLFLGSSAFVTHA